MKTFRHFLELPLPPCFRLNSIVPNFHLIKKQIDEYSKLYVEESAQDWEQTDIPKPSPLKLQSITNVEWVC